MIKELEADMNLSHYRIVSKIGAGGMGEVYLAEDTRLRRKVAIKVLPAEITGNRERLQRFEQEAFAASALNHPHILTIHEFGKSDDGTRFIVMEYVEGVTLNQRMASDEMNVGGILDIAAQVASALSAAHEAGIVHRDIKPENIMLRTDGYAKILDFGLAKLTEKNKITGSDAEAPTRALINTNPGAVMGTAAYMSPEQARGLQTDARTDIWSLGVVLYEMLTGRKPFTGATPTDVIVAVVNKEPPPISSYAPNVPAELVWIVEKALHKEPDERYQTAKELLADLRRVKRRIEFENELERSFTPEARSTKEAKAAQTLIHPQTTAEAATKSNQSQTHSVSSAEYIAQEIKSHKRSVLIILTVLLFTAVGLSYWYFSNRSTNTKQIESIAVLPFENKSSDADTEYLSDGLAESLIYRLSQLSSLKVSPTSSVFRYKGKESDPKTIGSELGVDAVMTGRIAQRGDNLTISIELVDVRNNKLIWGEQYQRKMSELLATQREIATEISRKLQLKLSGEETKGLTKRYTDNNEAYQLYLKGRYHFAKRTKDDMQRAIEYFQQAIRLDPNFALAYASIAECYNQMPSYPYLSSKEAFPLAKAAAQRALEIDPTLSEAHTALANYFAIYEWNWAEAERGFKRAIELDPNSSDAHFRYGQFYLAPLGRHDEAIAELKRAMELEPLSLVTGANLAAAYMYAGQNDRAVEQARKTYDLEPNFPAGRHNLGLAYIANGMYAEAIALSEKVLQTEPTNQQMLRVAGCGYAKSGRRQEAEEVIKRFRDIAKTQYVILYFVANIYASLGDKDKAFAELEKAFAERDFSLYRLKVDPLMDPLRDDPRFKEMMKRMNLPE